jgi:hypothetical protein
MPSHCLHVPPAIRRLPAKPSALLLDHWQPDRKLSRHLIQIAFGREIPMDALDSVLADLVDTDRDCAYATIKPEPLEALIYEWAAAVTS